jgi:glyoxylase-like metal-dependent hydrolase (beta-lactamase superfamily II)
MRVLREENAKWPASANVCLIPDAEGATLIDVGCGKEESYRALVEFLRTAGLAVSDVHTVILSHAHPDHMGAMRFLLEETSPRVFLHELEAPLAAQPSLLNDTFDLALVTEHLLGGDGEEYPESFDIIDYFDAMCPMARAVATQVMRAGDVIEAGGLRLEVVETPGHAPGHVSFFERKRRLLLAGDAVGKIVAWYSPSSGGALGYLAGLARMERLGAETIIPSHGPDITDVAGAIAHTRERILKMEERVLAQLGPEPASVEQICRAIYHNPGARVFPGVQIVMSHLEKLEAEGQVHRQGNSLVYSCVY